MEEKQQYRVIIAGGRYFENYDLVKEKCDYFLSEKKKTHQLIVVSGHATGADSLGERYAKENDLQCELHPADWDRFGKSAGPKRNAEMAEVANALIAFWDGQSRGTKNMIELAKSKRLKVAIVRYS